MNRALPDQTTSAGKPRGPSIFLQLLTSLLFMGTLLSLITAGNYLLLERTAKKEEIERHFAIDKETIAAFFNSVYESPVTRDLRYIEVSSVFTEYLGSRTIERSDTRYHAERLLIYFTDRQDGVYSSARFIDAHGAEQILVSGDKRVRELSSRDRFPKEDRLRTQAYELFKRLQASKDGSVLYGQPFFYNGTYTFFAGMRKTDPEIGGFAGAVLLQCDLSGFLRYLSSYRISRKQVASLFSMEGQILYGAAIAHPLMFRGATPSLRGHTSKDLAAVPQPGANFPGSETCTHCHAKDQPSFFYQTTKILRAGADAEPLFTLALTLPTELFLNQLKRGYWRLLLVTLFLLLLSAAMAYRISRKFSRPLSELIVAAKRLSEGNLATQIRVTARGELGTLIETFNRMTVLLLAAREKAESSNREVLKLYQATEQSPVTVVITDLTGAIEYVNPKFTEVSGYTREEVLGKNPRILKSGDLAPERYQELWRDLFLGKEWRGEFLNKKKNGELYWEYASISPIRNTHGTITHFLAVKEDITSRKHAEELLQQTASRLSLSVQAGGIGIWDYDIAHNKISWDDQMYRLYGIDAGMFSGTYAAWASALYPKDRQRNEEEVQMALRGEKEFDTEFRVLWPNGNIRYLRATAVVQRNASGHPVRMIGTNWDVTEHKQAEAVLLEQRTLLNDIILGGNIGTWRWNVPTGETEFNERWANIVGYTKEELGSINIKTWFDLAHPEDLKRSNELVARHFAGHLEYYECECRMKHKNGSWVWVEARGKVIHRDPEGKPLIMTGTHTDITVHKTAEGALQQAHRQLIQSEKLSAIGELGAGVAHELNQPLMGISMYLESLKKKTGVKSDGETMDVIRKIKEQIMRMSGVVTNLRKFAREVAPHPEVLDINQPLQDAFSLLRQQMIDHGIDAKMSAGKDLPEILGDANTLQQVFINMIANARDAVTDTNHTGEKKVSTESRLSCGGRMVEVRIEDSGPGMDEATQAKIFAPFFTTKTDGRGTGLGLSISEGIIRDHRGCIGVQSAPGKGTCFSVFLPAGKGSGNWDHLALCTDCKYSEPQGSCKVFETMKKHPFQNETDNQRS